MGSEIEKRPVPEREKGDFIVVLDNDECEPYMRRGDEVRIALGEELRDGDVGLFYDGNRAVIRQYCEDWAGNAYLFTLNRRRSGRDIFIPAAQRRHVCSFGKVVLKEPIALPER